MLAQPLPLLLAHPSVFLLPALEGLLRDVVPPDALRHIPATFNVPYNSNYLLGLMSFLHLYPLFQ
jgi:hypothetical protein